MENGLMAQHVAVVVTTQDAATDRAGLNLITGDRNWSKSEPGGADKVFTNRSGSYRVLSGGGGNATTELIGAGSRRAGVLRGLDPATVANGATGSGLSDDTGRALSWKVDGITDV
jgi:hypothetical protein